jgi:DNA-directed RNA polymerase subunit RPC12/RpoP
MENIKTLQFTCPQCGSHRLFSVEQCVIAYPIINISSDGDLDYDFDKADQGYGDAEVLHYACIECGFIPEDEQGHELNNCDELASWVEMNCPQIQHFNTEFKKDY